MLIGTREHPKEGPKKALNTVQQDPKFAIKHSLSSVRNLSSEINKEGRTNPSNFLAQLEVYEACSKRGIVHDITLLPFGASCYNKYSMELYRKNGRKVIFIDCSYLNKIKGVGFAGIFFSFF